LKELLTEPRSNCQEIKDIVVNNGGVDYTLEMAKDYIEKARKKLFSLPDNSYRKVLEGLTSRVLERNF
jgi:heptaprenyl diphosphate synthase